MLVLAGTVAATSGPTTGQLLATVLGAVGLGSVLAAIISGLFTRSTTNRQFEHDKERRDEERADAKERWNQDREDERERRAEERQDERERRIEDRRHALEDHWRDERFAAHADALTAFSHALRQAVDDRLDTVNGPKYRHEENRHLNQLLARVDMVASEKASRLGHEAFGRLSEVQTATRSIAARDRSSAEERKQTSDAYWEAHGELIVAIGNYRKAVREDLGTADFGPTDDEEGEEPTT